MSNDCHGNKLSSKPAPARLPDVSAKSAPNPLPPIKRRGAAIEHFMTRTAAAINLRSLCVVILSLALFAQSAHAVTLQDTDPGPGKGSLSWWIDNKLNPALQGVDGNDLGNGGAPVTAPYTIQPADAGTTLLLGTGSTGFFTVTVPSASGFPADAVINLVNGDTATLRGKGIAGLSGSGCSERRILWPGQTCKIGIVNGVWAVLSRPGRWRPPASPVLQFYSDFVNGTNSFGATDGLAPGASAFKSAQVCLTIAVDQIDFDTADQTQAVCNMAAATVDTTEIHLPFQGVVGAQGFAALQLVGASLSVAGAVSNGGLCEIAVPSTATYSVNEIVSVYGVGGATGCNGTWQVTVTDGTHLTLQSTTFGGAYTSGGTVTNGSVVNAAAPAFDCFINTMIETANIFWESTFQATSGCYIQMEAGNIFGGSPSGSLVNATTGAQIHFTADIGLASGASGAAAQADLPGSLVAADAAININFLPGINPTFGEFALADLQGQVNFGGVTINLNGNTVTGARCVANSAGYIASGTGNANTYFPGNSPCTQSGGGNIDGVVIPPNPSVSTLGGIKSIGGVSHQWINSIDNSGNPFLLQPACGDLSDATAPCNASVPGIAAYALLGYMETAPITINFGTAQDNAISTPLPTGYTQLRPGALVFSQCTGSLSGMTFGLFTTTGGAGGALVTAGATSNITAPASANTNGNFQFFNTVNNVNSEAYTPSIGAVQLRVSATVAQSCKVSFQYQPVP